MAHKELGFELAGKVTELLSEVATVEQQPQLAGRQLVFVVRANPSKKQL